MKIKITFDTADPDQRLEHQQVMKAPAALGALYDIDRLIGRMRHDIGEDEAFTPQQKEIMDQVLSKLREGFRFILEDHGIQLERLYP